MIKFFEFFAKESIQKTIRSIFYCVFLYLIIREIAGKTTIFDLAAKIEFDNGVSVVWQYGAIFLAIIVVILVVAFFVLKYNYDRQKKLNGEIIADKSAQITALQISLARKRGSSKLSVDGSTNEEDL